MEIVNVEQAAYWNGQEADHWVTDQRRYEEMLQPVVPILLDAAAVGPGDAVLDIGCGCGATTRAAARSAAPGGSVVGVDLSAPMLDRARAASAGATNVAYRQADAQIAAFEPASFDAAISRFGVMFFSDPVSAFANIGRAVRPHGRLAFAAWRGVSENEWFSLPVRTFAAFVAPEVPPSPGDGPGPFAFADPGAVRSILGDAGWEEVDVSPRDVDILFGGRGTLDDVVDFVEHGRAGKAMLGVLGRTERRRALDALRTALEPYVTPDGVRVTGAIWVVTARRQSAA